MENQKKSALHPRNLHQGRYDLEALSKTSPDLRPFVFLNEFGNRTIDFANPKAVKALNRALLIQYYDLEFWDIPEGFLCPPIPGRADYIHYLADLLAESNAKRLATADKIRVLDIGTGANLIYPILGHSSYEWTMVGSESNPLALSAAQAIIRKNPRLREVIAVRGQEDSGKIFSGVIQPDELFDLTLCNPPFHESEEAAQGGSQRKIRNLTGKTGDKARLNFGGQAAELWTEGGELEFIRKMIRESCQFKHQVFWFTTLVSKSENLKPIEEMLARAGVVTHKIVQMAQGNKQSRFVAWTFLSSKQQEAWRKFRWGK